MDQVREFRALDMPTMSGLSSPQFGVGALGRAQGGGLISSQASEATQTQPPRPRRRNPLTRLSASHLLMVVAAVLAFITNLMVLRSQDETRAVVVAASDLVSGRAVDVNDFRAVEVDVDDDLFSRLVPWQQMETLKGMVAARAIPAGDLIGPNDLRPESAGFGLRAMSIPIDAEHAVGGDLVVGDRIDLILVRDQVPEYVLVDAEVLSVSSNDRGALSVGGFYLVVGVDPERALAVAAAVQDGRIEVVRSTGADPIRVGAP